VKAIELRQAGWSWQRIVAEVGWTYQSLVRRIWMLLHARGELTVTRAALLLHDRRER